jgi:cellulose synthase/poly-beta-1,6-N-acetylglucosamine synthase-like glycosyltransferase
MTDPLVLKSPSNQSNILDISIFVWCFVLSLITFLPPLLIAGLILLQCKLHLVNWTRKEAQFMAK